jgi:tRNA A-37 threonylcarbamoyl transferase component Bud32
MARSWYEDGAQSLVESALALAPTIWLRRMPGRETFAWPGRADLIVKRFRGDAARERWHELLRARLPRSPARREAENLVALRGAGFAAPRPLAWREGAGGASALVMERVRHEHDLGQRLALAGGGERRAWLARLTRWVARLHSAGFYHRDLYLQHVVIDAAGELVLLDVGRVRRERAPRQRWFVKDLAALLHSAPTAVTRAERLRFLARYLAERGAGSGPSARVVRRRLARRVLAKARRLAAHAPRHVDPHSARAGVP